MVIIGEVWWKFWLGESFDFHDVYSYILTSSGVSFCLCLITNTHFKCNQYTKYLITGTQQITGTANHRNDRHQWKDSWHHSVSQLEQSNCCFLFALQACFSQFLNSSLSLFNVKNWPRTLYALSYFLFLSLVPSTLWIPARLVTDFCLIGWVTNLWNFRLMAIIASIRSTKAINSMHQPLASTYYLSINWRPEQLIEMIKNLTYIDNGILKWHGLTS